jgi:hypothetical protein
MRVTFVGAALILAGLLLILSVIGALTRKADPDQSSGSD